MNEREIRDLIRHLRNWADNSDDILEDQREWLREAANQLEADLNG